MVGRATESTLKKALIQVLDERESTTAEIPVLFNPTEYSIDKQVTYSDQSLPGLGSPITQFVSGDAETLSMELFFDTYEAGTDVRDHTDRIDGLLRVDEERHAPPVCRFAWGSLVFTAVLESASTTFTMFLPEGTPVRARIDVTFKAYTRPGEETTAAPRQSADRTKVWEVTGDDTLWTIAAAVYGDPTRWRSIATANDIENPRSLPSDRELIVPPLEGTR
ncbi:CIS tube protein [Halalkalicoccus ordinarius]|uniref:CIS tube protein n=1 Tax=Halalkalicoccus ordinarius TaxID=3116651 RepID=UPI00300F5EC3